MDFVRNLEEKKWWINGFHRDGKTLERINRRRELEKRTELPLYLGQLPNTRETLSISL